MSEYKPSVAAMEMANRYRGCACIDDDPVCGDCFAMAQHVDYALKPERERVRVLRKAVEWVLNDAWYKPSDQVGDTTYRWLTRLSTALAAFDKKG